MDVTSFLAGQYLKHTDLPTPMMTVTIQTIEIRQLDSEDKICLFFTEFPKQSLACNATNLKRVAQLCGVDSNQWAGKQLLLYRSRTDFGGKDVLCLRVGPPNAPPQDILIDAGGNVVAPMLPAAATVAQQPVPAAPPQQQPQQVVQQPAQQSVWAGLPAQQQQNPPGQNPTG